MINLIKKYRNNPNRTVITLKCDKSWCLNKLGDINMTSGDYCSCLDKENCDEQSKKSRKESKLAYKELEIEAQEQGSAKESVDKDQNGQAEQMLCKCHKVSQEFVMPTGEKSTKGGVCTQKTLRILLCDVVAVTVVALGSHVLWGCMKTRK